MQFNTNVLNYTIILLITVSLITQFGLARESYVLFIDTTQKLQFGKGQTNTFLGLSANTSQCNWLKLDFSINR